MSDFWVLPMFIDEFANQSFDLHSSLQIITMLITGTKKIVPNVL